MHLNVTLHHYRDHYSNDIEPCLVFDSSPCRVFFFSTGKTRPKSFCKGTFTQVEYMPFNHKPNDLIYRKDLADLCYETPHPAIASSLKEHLIRLHNSMIRDI